MLMPSRPSTVMHIARPFLVLHGQARDNLENLPEF